jgi:hypothetical protein
MEASKPHGSLAAAPGDGEAVADVAPAQPCRPSLAALLRRHTKQQRALLSEQHQALVEALSAEEGRLSEWDAELQDKAAQVC